MQPNTSSTGQRRRRLAPWLVLLLTASCDPPPPERSATDTRVEPPPGVLLPPTPTEDLITLDPLDSTDSADGLDKPAPQPLRPRPFERGVAPSSSELESTKAGATLTMQGRLRWPQRDPTPRLDGLSGDDLDQAKLQLSRRFSIELDASGNMRWRLLGGAFPLPSNTTILGRADRYGYLLVWPNAEQYRVLPRGSLRNLMRERRVDVAPLVNAQRKTTAVEGGRRFGYELERSTLTTERGTVILDLALVNESEHAGIPLCRALLELAAVTPSGACENDRVPLKATYRTGEHELEFVIDSFKLRTDSYATIDVPPQRARFVSRGLPGRPESLQSRAILSALAPGSETGSLEVVNGSELAAYLTLRDVPVAHLAPRSRIRLPGLSRGEHLLGLVGFFGEPLRGPEPLTVGDERAIISLASELPDAGANE